MWSLLVRATFGEMVAGKFVLQSGKRSSENGFQTTFGLVGKGGSLERPRPLQKSPSLDSRNPNTGF
ncbi:hypothetical protein, partial [Neisseria lactamica]|uniref:hypothetical protein n=1 Tax=Neisseria lactamica TaxID=486 RepID=UPI0012907003